MLAHLRFLAAVQRRYDRELAVYLSSQFAACGEGVTLKMPLMIQHPEGLHVGSHTKVGAFTSIFARGGVTIGSHCWISTSCAIVSSDHPLDPVERRKEVFPVSPIIIGDDVWLGTGTTILRGVTIGDGAVVGAGAVVTKDVAAHTTVVGIPARPAG